MIAVFRASTIRRPELGERILAEETAQAMAINLLIGVVLNGVGAAKSHLQNLPPLELARGIQRMFSIGLPGDPVRASLFGDIPNLFGYRLFLYRQVRGTLNAEDVRALFDLPAQAVIDQQAMDRLIGGLNSPSNSSLGRALASNDFWAALPHLLPDAAKRIKFLEDLANGSDELVAVLGRMDFGGVRAWEVMRNYPYSRVEIKTLESGNRLISSSLLNNIPEILQEEVIAFHRYTVSSFSMNGHLNAGQQLVGFEAEFRSLLRSGINQLQNSARKHVGNLFRGQSLPENLILEKYVLPFQQGQVLGGPVYVTENAFLSTTRSNQIADNFIQQSLTRGGDDHTKRHVLFHINSKTGVYIDDVSNYGTNFCAANPSCTGIQEEVLMIDGLTFRINDVTITDVEGHNFYQIYLEEL